jgi:hypothetical protein
MWKDPIIEELHTIREKLAQRFGNDTKRISAYCEAQSALSTRVKVEFSPRRPFGWSEPLTQPAVDAS